MRKFIPRAFNSNTFTVIRQKQNEHLALSLELIVKLSLPLYRFDLNKHNDDNDDT